MVRHAFNDLGQIATQFLDPNICHGSTLTTFDALLKERYIDSDRVEELVYPENVLLGKLEKKGDTGMVGDQMPVPIFTKNPQGVGGKFTDAQTNATNSASSKFTITAGDYYGVVTIGDKVMMASRTNQGAFLENKMVEIDGLYETVGENYSIYLWGNGGQALGRIQSISGNDIILVEPSTIQNFEVGMTVVASANDGATTTDAERDSGDGTTVAAINRATGYLQLTSAAAISGLAVGDYLFRQGDFFGDQGTVVITGVQAFIAATDAPPALWGISAATRATDPQRYAGCRVDPAQLGGKNMEERIRLLFAQMRSRFKAKNPTEFYMNPEDFETLATLMGARAERSMDTDSTKFGYSKIDIVTSGGTIPIFADRHCPVGTGFAFNSKNHWISSMGELIHVQNGDGLQMLRKGDSTDYEFRLIGYPLYANNCPRNHGRVLLAS